MSEPDPIFCPDCGAEMVERHHIGGWGEWVALAISSHEAECGICQRELAFLAEGGRPDLGETLTMADKIDRAMAVNGG